jgi:hypothetical protein
LHLATPDKFGALKKGIITVEGNIQPATVQYRPLPPELSYAEAFKRQEAKLFRNGKEAHMWPDFVLDTASPDHVKAGDVVYCLPTQADGGYHPPAVHGVVLRRAASDPTMFSRIGAFRSSIEWLGPSQTIKLQIR